MLHRRNGERIATAGSGIVIETEFELRVDLRAQEWAWGPCQKWAGTSGLQRTFRTRSQRAKSGSVVFASSIVSQAVHRRGYNLLNEDFIGGSNRVAQKMR